jgi:hypothetical protein
VSLDFFGENQFELLERKHAIIGDIVLSDQGLYLGSFQVLPQLLER